MQVIKDFCASKGIKASFSEIWGKGSEGGLELAEFVINEAEKNTTQHNF